MDHKEEGDVVSPGNGDANTSPLLGDQNNGNLLMEGNGKKVTTVTDDPEDGAGDRLVPGDAKVSIISNKDSTEVKFNLSDSQNGDAKIDIERIKIAFAGMGKEELMKFASDPFWVRLRWFLFVAFWLIWAAMLAGAIAIIVIAPKCASPEPLKWWEQGPLYQVYVRSFKDGSESQQGNGDLKGLISKLDYIQGVGMKGVTISSILKSDRPRPSGSPRSSHGNDEDIIDFQEVDPMYGSIDDFKNLLEQMKTRGLHLVMSFILNHSSNKHPWFTKSELKEKPYDEYYIWAPSSGTGFDGLRIPPNNWLSVDADGDSAWKWSDTRGEFYLHQFREDQPDLNFHNRMVIEEIKKVLLFWLDLGVDGFQFEKTQFLLEDINLKNESTGRVPGTVHDQYDFYSHHQTRNLPDVVDILSEFKQVVLKHRGIDGFMTIAGNTPISWTELYGNHSNSVIDLPRNTSLFSKLVPGFNGEDLKVRVDKWLSALPKGTRPGWQLGDWWTSRLASDMSDDVDGLNMIAMLLPGTPITLYGEEIGMGDTTGTNTAFPMQWSNDTEDFSKGAPWIPVTYSCMLCNVKAQQDAHESHLKVYKALAEARKSPSIMYGGLETITAANETVFAYTRIKSGNPGYLVAFNTGDHDVTANLSELDNLDELTVAIRSSNINSADIAIKSKWPKEGVLIPAKGALVLTFVPKKND